MRVNKIWFDWMSRQNRIAFNVINHASLMGIHNPDKICPPGGYISPGLVFLFQFVLFYLQLRTTLQCFTMRV